MTLLAVGSGGIVNQFVILSLVIIVVGFLLRLLNQPSVITYILVGVIVGPFGFDLVTNEQLITNLGNLGLVLLLFFIGMEIHLPQLIANWRISILGTLIQVAVSIGVVALIGIYFDFGLAYTIFFGFVISISSTAVIVKMLDEKGIINTRVGQNVLGILLVQDVLVVLMLISINYMGGDIPSGLDLLKQVIGAALMVGIILLILWKKEVKIPFMKQIMRDHELQVFIAFTSCFGFAYLTGFLGISEALGAFVAGMLISATRATRWISDNLLSFKVLFVALFFVSIGLIIDLEYIVENYLLIGLLVVAVFFTNHVINMLIIKAFGNSWRTSIYSGAMLAQIGEFSFILGSAGLSAAIIGQGEYNLIVSVIALSLFLSPFYISFSRFVCRVSSLTPSCDVQDG